MSNRHPFLARLFASAVLAASMATAHAAEVVRLGVTAGPHAQITEIAKKVAARDGVDLHIVEFQDYIRPDAALDAGDLDANSYQHLPFLESQIQARGYKISAVGFTAAFPMGFYSKRVKSLAELPRGAKVGAWHAIAAPVDEPVPEACVKDAAVLDVHVRRKRYGERTVLHDVRLRMRPSEIVALVGASGCGKSTLLRLVAGLDTAYEGHVKVRGRLQDAPSSDVGFVFQEPRLFPWCSVADNVAFGQTQAAADGAHVAALLAEVGLSDRERALPKHLSGGQAQRVALARGLAGQPRVLLLDEPFSAVDAFTRMKLQEMLVRLVQHHQVAALVVTHDIDEAAWLADRVLVLDAEAGRPRHAIDVPIARPREREGVTLAAARARIFEGLRDAHAF